MTAPNFVIARNSKGFAREEESVENQVQKCFPEIELTEYSHFYLKILQVRFFIFLSSTCHFCTTEKQNKIGSYCSDRFTG